MDDAAGGEGVTEGFVFDGRVPARLGPAALRVAAAAAEAGLLVAYMRQDSLVHWLVHLYAGGGAAMLVAAAVAWHRRRPVASLWVWVVAGHALATFPDALFAAGMVHERWMDIFVAHVSTHHVAGRELTLLATFLGALAVYLVMLDVARRRYWTGELFVRACGDGPPVVLLHGLGASSRYWTAVAGRLRAVRVVAPDLLGFGLSPKPRAGYGPADHVAALARVVPDGAVLVGHSTGAIIAAALAAAEPVKALALVLVGLPAFPDAPAARAELGRLGPLAGWTVSRPPLAWLLCQLMCALRPLAVALAPVLLRDVPPSVAADAARHRWRSFRGTLDGVVIGHQVLPDLVAAGLPVVFVHGRADRDAPVALVERLAAELRRADTPVETIVADGGHHLPVHRPDVVVGAVHRALRTAGNGRAAAVRASAP